MADDESDWEFGADDMDGNEDNGGDIRESGDSDTSGEWRFSLSDLEGDQSAVEGNVFGSSTSDSEVIEAGSPAFENVLFLIVGVLLALAFFLQFYLAGAGP